MKAVVLTISFLGTLLFMSGRYVFMNSAPDNSVMGVSHSLACRWAGVSMASLPYRLKK